MLSSTALTWALTGAFVVTGAVALGRLTAPATGARSGGRTAEFSHLLMSVAMVAAVWGRGGGPGAGAVQIVVFTLVAAFFLASLVRPVPGHGRAGDACHLLTAGAMVFMVAATPVLMGHRGVDPGAGGAPDGVGMAGMGPTAGTEGTAPPAPVPAWAVALALVLVALLLLVAARWAARAVRPLPDPAPAGGPPWTTARVGALCHLLMSLGMAAMLLAML